jgi:hypothetical protein
MRGKGRIGGKARSDVSSRNDTPPPASPSKSGESNVSKTATFFLCVAAIYASYISQGLLQENMSVVLSPLYYAVLKLVEISFHHFPSLCNRLSVSQEHTDLTAKMESKKK